MHSDFPHNLYNLYFRAQRQPEELIGAAHAGYFSMALKRDTNQSIWKHRQK
jgi:organic hydroperoxide reductase OsmC/OhrA